MVGVKMYCNQLLKGASEER